MNGIAFVERCPLSVPLPDVSTQDTLGNGEDIVLYFFQQVEIETLADTLVNFWWDTGGVHVMNDVGGNHCTSCLIRGYCIQARVVTGEIMENGLKEDQSIVNLTLHN